MKHANIRLCGQPTLFLCLTRLSQDPIKTDIMKTSDGYIRVCLKVTGRVQGVGFRFWALRSAESLNLSGVVSNSPDGSVDALFCGRIDTVDKMIQLCNRGSNYSKVNEVIIISREPVTVCPDGFRILR